MATLNKVKLNDLKNKTVKATREEYFSEKNKQELQRMCIDRINGAEYCGQYALHNTINVRVLEETDKTFNREFTCDNLQVYVMEYEKEDAINYFNTFGKVTNTEYIEKINRVKLTIENFKIDVQKECVMNKEDVTLNIKNSLSYTITTSNNQVIHAEPIKASMLKYDNDKVELHRETLCHTTLKYTLDI